MDHAGLFKFQLFKGHVSYNALKEVITEYVGNCESFVSNFAFEKSRPARSKVIA